MPKAQTPQQDHADHHTGAPHRHLETGQQSVAQRSDECQRTGRGQPGQSAWPQSPAGETCDQRVNHASKQANVLTGNHQQVHGAGVLQYLPVATRQPRAIAQHQRGQPAFPALCIDRQQTLTNTVAPGRMRGRQPSTVHHRTGRADALGQQPGLIIESIRVNQPTGALELDRQTPALAAAHLRAAVPRHTDQRRQLRPPRRGVRQLETNHALGNARQTDHFALQPQRLAVQPLLQTVIQCPLRRNTRPREAEQKQRQWIGAKRQQHQRQYRHQQHEPGRR